MGQFSWMSVDDYTKSVREGKEAIVLIPKEFGGGYLHETNYEGYGKFAGRDAYGLIVEWNEPEKFVNDDESRGLGINLACYEKDHAELKYPLKIVSLTNRKRKLMKELKDGSLTYESVKGFSLSDPNQGWMAPDKCDLKYLEDLYNEYVK